LLELKPLGRFREDHFEAGFVSENLLRKRVDPFDDVVLEDDFSRLGFLLLFYFGMFLFGVHGFKIISF